MRKPLLAGLALLAAAQAPAPAPRFPPPSRPVSSIVTNRWSDEDERERTGEAETVLRLSGVRAGQTTADIGAGEGYYVVKLARAVGPTGLVYGEDIVPRYVRGLQRRVARLRNVRTVLGTSDDPRLPAQSIDRAFMIHMYHEISQPYALLWRLHGSMKPGGLVGVVDNDRPTDSHGTPPALLRCEFAAVGYRQVAFHSLEKAGGYLALFAPTGPRPEPRSIKACKQG